MSAKQTYAVCFGISQYHNLRALSWRARMRRLWQLAFPPRSFVRHTLGTRSRAALPLLYVYRGARGVARLFRKAR